MIDISQFTLPNERIISHIVPGTFSFDSEISNNKTLLITIGDSWTWGDELDPEHRKNQCFGNILAKRKNSDWLNLSVPGLGNQYIGMLMQELSDMPWLIKYTHIDIIIVLTEIGRDFDGWFDRDVDYAKWLRSNISQPEDYTEFLAFINNRVCQQIIESHKKITNSRLLVATNFIDPVGFEDLSGSMVEKSWFDVLEPNLEHPCYFVSSYIFQKLRGVLDMEWSLDSMIFDEWANLNTDRALKRISILENSKMLFPRRHPTVESHEIWADYLYQKIL